MTDHKRTFAPLLLAFLLAPTVFVACSSNAAPIPSGAALTCADSTATKHAGRLTIGSTDPGTPPWMGGDPNEDTINMPAGQSGWTVGNPYDMEGFEMGVAYSLANSMGYESDHVDWVKVSTADAVAPGAKAWDMTLAQVATRIAGDGVDVSAPYLSSNEAVVALPGKSISSANSIAALATYKLGAVAGSAGESAVSTVVKPAAPVTPFPDLVAAVAGLRTGAVDGLVVNVNVAAYLQNGWHEGNSSTPPLQEAVIVGQFASTAWSDDYAVVLEKGSALTSCVNQAVDEIKRQGLLDEYTDEYITNTGTIPTLQ